MKNFGNKKEDEMKKRVESLLSGGPTLKLDPEDERQIYERVKR